MVERKVSNKRWRAIVAYMAARHAKQAIVAHGVHESVDVPTLFFFHEFVTS